MRVFENRRGIVTIAVGVAVLTFGALELVSASAQEQASAASRQSDAAPATPTNQSSLQTLVDEALSQSPLVLAARHRWEASTKAPIQAATIPDPEITLQEFTVGGPRPLEGYETSDFYYTGFGFSQDLPWPTKLRLQAAQARDEAEYARQTYESARRTVAEKVREPYFELFFLKKALDILGQSRGDLEQIEKITEARYRLGQGQEQDVIRAQLEATSILEQIEVRRQEAGQRQAELKAILGRDPGSADVEVGDVAPSKLELDSRRLGQLAREASPELRMAQAMEAKSADALKLARANYIPDLSVGYMYQKTGPSFRDYYMLTVGAKIPLYFWRRQTPAAEQAALDKRAARTETRARELEILSSADSALIGMQTASRVMTLYRDGLIPQAQANRAAALNAYRVGKADFQTLVSAVLELLALNQGYYRALADHEIAAARIQQIIGDVP
jgi:outer membrane protein, heavy metal efflux system